MEDSSCTAVEIRLEAELNREDPNPKTFQKTLEAAGWGEGDLERPNRTSHSLLLWMQPLVRKYILWIQYHPSVLAVLDFCCPAAGVASVLVELH